MVGLAVGARHSVFLETPGVEWVSGIRPGFMQMWLGWLVGANELLRNRVSPRHPVSGIRARFTQMWLGWLLGPDTRCFGKHRVSTQLSGWETECLQDTGFAGIRARFIQMWLGWPVRARHSVFLETPGV